MTIVSMTERLDVRIYPLRWARDVEPRWPETPSLAAFSYPKPCEPWRYRPATWRQLERLRAYGLTLAPDERRRRIPPAGLFSAPALATLTALPAPPVRLTIGKAAFLIDCCVELDTKYDCQPLPASERQRRWLGRRGIYMPLTRAGASKLITEIQARERDRISSHLISR